MKAVVLAAGKGTRLMSEKFNLPKVLREALSRPLLSYVLENIDYIEKKDTVIVVGYMGDKVREFAGGEYRFALQKEQKGTGHAVMMTRDELKDYDGDVIILCGDMPLFKKETYLGICEKHAQSGAALTIMTVVAKNGGLPYGRIIRDENGNISDIVEDKDATPEQKAINELNVGVFVVKCGVLFDALDKIGNNNKQGEYYLTDLPKILISEGQKVDSFTTYDVDEIVGVNTLEDLEYCEKILTERANNK